MNINRLFDPSSCIVPIVIKWPQTYSILVPQVRKSHYPPDPSVHCHVSLSSCGSTSAARAAAAAAPPPSCAAYSYAVMTKALWVSRVLKYPKKCLEDLTMFSCLLDEGIPKEWRKLNSHDGFLSYLQTSTANSVHLAAHFCPALVCPQKATVRIQFLPYFWNPLIK